MKPIQELALLISEFPGIGPKQARRIVQFLLTKDDASRKKLATAIEEIRSKTSQCKVCFRYDDARTNGTCTICGNPERDSTQLMVVEKDVDIEAIEASGAYRGLYFVLGGLMPLTTRKNGPKLRTEELKKRAQKGGLKEIILGLSATPEGDFTAREATQQLAKLRPDQDGVKMTTLGRGLSLGAELEYADPETLRSALQGRVRDEEQLQ